MYLMSQTVYLKMVKMVNFMLHVFYYDKKKRDGMSAVIENIDWNAVF